MFTGFLATTICNKNKSLITGSVLIVQRACSLLKEGLWHRRFRISFARFFKTAFFFFAKQCTSKQNTMEAYFCYGHKLLRPICYRL